MTIFSRTNGASFSPVGRRRTRKYARERAEISQNVFDPALTLLAAALICADLTTSNPAVWPKPWQKKTII